MKQHLLKNLRDIGFNIKEVDSSSSFNSENYVEVIPWKSKLITGYALSFLGLILLPNLADSLVWIAQFLIKDEPIPSLIGLLISTIIGLFAIACFHRGINRLYNALGFKIILQKDILNLSRRISIPLVTTRYSNVQAFLISQHTDEISLVAKYENNEQVKIITEKIDSSNTKACFQELSNYLNDKLMLSSK